MARPKEDYSWRLVICTIIFALNIATVNVTRIQLPVPKEDGETRVECDIGKLINITCPSDHVVTGNPYSWLPRNEVNCTLPTQTSPSTDFDSCLWRKRSCIQIIRGLPVGIVDIKCVPNNLLPNFCQGNSINTTNYPRGYLFNQGFPQYDQLFHHSCMINITKQNNESLVLTSVHIEEHPKCLIYVQIRKFDRGGRELGTPLKICKNFTEIITEPTVIEITYINSKYSTMKMLLYYYTEAKILEEFIEFSSGSTELPINPEFQSPSTTQTNQETIFTFEPWMAIAIAAIVLFMLAVVAMVMFIWFYKKRTANLELQRISEQYYKSLSNISATSS